MKKKQKRGWGVFKCGHTVYFKIMWSGNVHFTDQQGE